MTPVTGSGRKPSADPGYLKSASGKCFPLATHCPFYPVGWRTGDTAETGLMLDQCQGETILLNIWEPILVGSI